MASNDLERKIRESIENQIHHLMNCAANANTEATRTDDVDELRNHIHELHRRIEMLFQTKGGNIPEFEEYEFK